MIPRTTDDGEAAGMAALVTQGAIPPDLARGLMAALRALDGGAEAWNVARLKRDPGRMLSLAAAGAPQVLIDDRRRGAEPVAVIAAGDLRGLVAALLGAVPPPRFATGREIHGALARAGASMEVTWAGPPERLEPPMSIETALAARPVARWRGWPRKRRPRACQRLDRRFRGLGAPRSLGGFNDTTQVDAHGAYTQLATPKRPGGDPVRLALRVLRTGTRPTAPSPMPSNATPNPMGRRRRLRRTGAAGRGPRPEVLAIRRLRAGGQRTAIMYTLIGTAKLNGVAPQAWLADVIARISGRPVSLLPELLRWN